MAKVYGVIVASLVFFAIYGIGFFAGMTRVEEDAIKAGLAHYQTEKLVWHKPKEPTPPQKIK